MILEFEVRNAAAHLRSCPDRLPGGAVCEHRLDATAVIGSRDARWAVGRRNGGSHQADAGTNPVVGNTEVDMRKSVTRGR